MSASSWARAATGRPGRGRMELGSLIRRHRGELGLSQDALARAIFVSRQTISNWETDKTYPDVQSLLLMSDLFGVSIDQLVKGDMEMINAEIERDAKRMSVLSNVMSVFLIFSIIVPTLGALEWGWGIAPSLVIFVLGWGITLTAAGMVETIKKRRRLSTYRDISAFMRGELAEGTVDTESFRYRHPIYAGIIMAGIGGLFGAVVVLVTLFVSRFF